MFLKDIRKPIGNGITIPHLVKLSDDKLYVLKFPGNPEKELVLINEFICHRLASDLGLPLQPFEIVEVNHNHFQEFQSCISDDIEHKEGYAFCSLYNKRANPIITPTIIKLASNQCDVFSMIIFDLLIFNSDRNQGNLLYDQVMKKIVLIDHTHVFDLGSLWTARELNLRKNMPFTADIIFRYNFELYSNFKNYNLDCITQYMDFIAKVKNYKKVQISDIISECKSYWFISEDDSQALKEYLWERFQRIDEAVDLLNLKRR